MKEFNLKIKILKVQFLLGGTIDDLIFKNYTETLEGKNKITLLNPKKFSQGYYLETGWVTSSKNIDLPSSKTNLES